MYFNNKKSRYFYVPPTPWRRKGYPHGLCGGSYRPGENGGFLVGCGSTMGNRSERVLARVEQALNFVDKLLITQAKRTGQPVEISKNLYELMSETNKFLNQKRDTNQWDALKTLGKYGAITAGIALPAAAYLLGKPQWSPERVAKMVNKIRGIKGFWGKLGDKILDSKPQNVFTMDNFKTAVQYGLPLYNAYANGSFSNLGNMFISQVAAPKQQVAKPYGAYEYQVFPGMGNGTYQYQVFPGKVGKGVFNMGAGLRQRARRKLMGEALKRVLRKQRHLMIC